MEGFDEKRKAHAPCEFQVFIIQYGIARAFHVIKLQEFLREAFVLPEYHTGRAGPGEPNTQKFKYRGNMHFAGVFAGERLTKVENDIRFLFFQLAHQLAYFAIDAEERYLVAVRGQRLRDLVHDLVVRGGIALMRFVKKDRYFAACHGLPPPQAGTIC